MTVMPTLPAATGRRSGAEYEYRVVTFSRETSREAASTQLTEEAEYGRWELARVVVYMGGARRVWLRRRIMRVRRTV